MRDSPKDILKTTRFSRRQFFRHLGIGLGGAAISGAILASACESAVTTSLPESSEPAETTDIPTTTDTTAIPTTDATAIQTTPGSNVSSTDVPPTVSTEIPTVTPTGYYYEPPAELPPMIAVPDSTCTIAKDRLYSLEHVWVKSIESDIAVIGITTSLVAILYQPFHLVLTNLGVQLKQYDSFGEIEGYKTMADLIAPVSCEVVGRNEYLVRQDSGWGGCIASLDGDSYLSGWMLVVKLKNPAELDELLTPEGYLERLGKSSEH